MTYKSIKLGPFFPKTDPTKPDARTDSAFEASSADDESDKVALDMASGPSIYKGTLPQPGTVAGPGPTNDKGES